MIRILNASGDKAILLISNVISASYLFGMKNIWWFVRRIREERGLS